MEITNQIRQIVSQVAKDHAQTFQEEFPGETYDDLDGSDWDVECLGLLRDEVASSLGYYGEDLSDNTREILYTLWHREMEQLLG